MLDETKVKKVVDCILEGCTIKEVHEKTGYSERTIQNYIRALNKEDSNVYNPLVYQKVRLKQEQISRERNKLGGKISSYLSSVSMEERINMAKIVLANDFTINEASIYFDIPSSTLYEYLISINDRKLLEELQDLFAHHKQSAFNSKR